jgi:superfamily I DNA/RNA helicase
MPSVELLPLIKEDGSPFTSAEVVELSEGLGGLDVETRASARDRNSDAIAIHDASRMLVVSGPGTGKSTLFKGRMKHWLASRPAERVVVATFVRKLVRDLKEDVATDPRIDQGDKARIDVMTLHRLARSIVERNRGTQELPLEQHCLVVSREWEEMVWRDAVFLQGEHHSDDFPWEALLEQLYDGELRTEAGWAILRESHVRLEQFYNALTFPDLILFATRAAIENAELVANIVFIIDEFQDFNLAEDSLIRAITTESPAVLLAGDDDQVLYDRLRRGHPSIIRGYYRDTSFMNAMLPFCSRCSFHICRTAETFLAVGRPAESIEKVFLPLDDESDAEPVTVVASTSPKTGVEYIEQLFLAHEDAIRQRREELAAGSEKDACILILTPAREMNFLNVAGARERLRELLREYAPGSEPLSSDYWRVRDYYYAGGRPAQNYGVRKILSFEDVEQEIVTSLLREALETGRNLAELEHETIRSCLAKCAAVGAILDSGQKVTEQADAIAAIGLATESAVLARDLERRPLRGETDTNGDAPEFEQNEITGAIDLTTIVGAKGLTADHVIVLGCDDVNLERVSRSAFLVALTRARKSLTVMACVGGGGATKLHPFACSLPDSHTRALFAKAGSVQEYETIGALQDHLERWAYARAMSGRRR